MTTRERSSSRTDRLPDPKRSRHSEVASSSRRDRSPSAGEDAHRRERERARQRERSRERDRPMKRNYEADRRYDDGGDRRERNERGSRYAHDEYESSSRRRERDRDDRDYGRDRERDRDDRDRDRRYRPSDTGDRDRRRDHERDHDRRDRDGRTHSPRASDSRRSTGGATPKSTLTSTPNGGASPLPIPTSISTPIVASGGSASPLPTLASPSHPTSTSTTTAETDKQKKARERMEAWKKAQAAKKAAEEVKKLVEEKAKGLGAKVGVVASGANGSASGSGSAVVGTSLVVPIKAAGGVSIGGLPAKPSFALPNATLARIGLPLKPAFAALPTTSLTLAGTPTPTSSTTQKASALLDDTDHSTRKLQKLALPPIDPLVAPGAGVGAADAVGDDLDFMDDDDDEDVDGAQEDEDAMDVDGEPNGSSGPPIARKRLIAAARKRFDIGPDKMDVDPPTTNGISSQVLSTVEDDEEEDPLDAFMKENTKTVKKVNEEDMSRFGVSAATTGRLQPLGGAAADEGPEDEEADVKEGNPGEMTAEQILAMAAKKSRKKDLPPPDHENIKYEPFRKTFYIPGPDTDDLDEEAVELMRLEMDGIKIRGKDCPKPVTHWGAFGLPSGCYDVIKRLGYDHPTPIQAQAVPAIMSGRDIIGVAKTGSGKTIAFLLPLFRHIKDQRPIESGEGPMAIIMTPTRELATQIWREAKPFMTAMGMRAVCAYGGSPLSEQIADMKKGCEVVVCTPGRMIDLLTANSGRVTNVRRVTYMVLDEADRMFDMGFEPQVMKIINNVRPDRQTVLFSATFPQKMDALARKILVKPLEITVGGRSVVAKEIDQRVEILPQSSKWLRLLEILGEMGEDHKDDDDFRTLVFVERQESADELFQNLMQKGYICASLHGGKDQVDRDQAISDFKAGYIPIVIATSVAARGLDVKELKLVINYDCPNHMEDYIHRAGRTGRAGNKGTCMTFITPEQDKFSVDIVRALKASEAYIPPDLQKLSEDFLVKVKAGKAKTAGSGFGGKGLDHIEQEREDKDRAQRSAYGEDGAREETPSQALVKIGGEGRLKRTGDAGTGSNEPGSHSGHGGHTGAPGEADYTFSDFKVEIMPGPAPERIAAANAKAAARNGGTASGGVLGDVSSLPPQTLAALQKAELAGKGTDVMGNLQAAVAKIQAALNKNKTTAVPMSMTGQTTGTGEKDGDGEPTEWHAIVPINNYPQKARWSATAKEHMSQLQDLSGASITNKGLFYPPGVTPKEGQEPPLYLLIESVDRNKVAVAVEELRRRIVDASIKMLNSEDRHVQPAGRYRV